MINAYEVGLLYKHGTYQRMVKEGAHWVWPSEKIEVYHRATPFIPAFELNILLKDQELAEILHVVEVKEHELVLQYENGLLKQALPPGRYAFWKGIIVYGFVRLDLGKIEITENLDRATLMHKLVAPYVRTATVENHEKALLFVDGKYIKTLESGVYYWWKNNITVNIGKVDTRQLQLEINGQEILTRDKAALRINAWAQYKVTDIEKALLQNKEYEKQLYVAFQLALREYIGGMSFDELLEKKETAMPIRTFGSKAEGQTSDFPGRPDKFPESRSFGNYVLEKVQLTAETMGIQVAGFGIRDIVLPGDVKDIMNQVLIAEKKAQANIILRREETASTRNLLNTAKLMEDNPMLFKLKEMEYVEKIAEKVSSISVNGNGVLIDQLRQIFTASK
jgi:regulator of protease activity HflC (stomatin/prohibitin superfamily)